MEQLDHAWMCAPPNLTFYSKHPNACVTCHLSIILPASSKLMGVGFVHWQGCGKGTRPPMR